MNHNIIIMVVEYLYKYNFNKNESKMLQKGLKNSCWSACVWRYSLIFLEMFRAHMLVFSGKRRLTQAELSLARWSSAERTLTCLEMPQSPHIRFL